MLQIGTKKSYGWRDFRCGTTARSKQNWSTSHGTSRRSGRFHCRNRKKAISGVYARTKTKSTSDNCRQSATEELIGKRSRRPRACRLVRDSCFKCWWELRSSSGWAEAHDQGDHVVQSLLHATRGWYTRQNWSNHRHASLLIVRAFPEGGRHLAEHGVPW